MELAIENEIDRYSLAIDVIDRVPRLQRSEPTPRKSSVIADWVPELRAPARHRRAGRCCVDLALLNS